LSGIAATPSPFRRPEPHARMASEYPPGQMRIVQEGFFKEDRLDIAA
jgi:hypothetical protein